MTQNVPSPAPAPPVVPNAPADDASAEAADAADAARARWARPQRIFPWLALLFGLPLAFLTAPFQVPDEPSHFYRAYQISEGRLLPVYRYHRGGGDLPENLEAVALRFKRLEHHPAAKTSRDEIRDAMRVPLDAGRRKFTEFVSSIYSPAAYVPQSIAIFLGRQIGLGPLGLMYAGRVGNLLFWVALSGLALRSTPACRRPFLLLLLMPMTLYQAASLSADPTTNGLALLFTAMVLRQANVRGTPGAGVVGGERPAGVGAQPGGAEDPPAPAPRIRFVGFLAFAVVVVLLALAKFVYLPLLALLFLIPPARFGGRMRFLAAAVLLGAVGLAASMAWTAQTEGLDTVVANKDKERKISPSAQIQNLRAHPLILFRLAGTTTWRYGSAIVRSFVGWLGWLDTPMSHWFTNAYLIALCAACWLDEKRWCFPIGWLLVIVIVPVALSTFAVAILNYLYTMPVGWDVIGGVQGRYLIPLAPAVCVLLWGLTRGIPRPRSPGTARAIDLAAVALICIGGVYTLLTVWTRFYGHVGRG